MSFLQLYAILHLTTYSNKLFIIFLGTGIFLILAGAFSWFFANDVLQGEERKEGQRKSFKLGKLSIYPFVLALLFGFIPSKETMIYIIGGYAVTNVEGIEKLPPNILSAMNKFLEDFQQPEDAK